MPVIKIQDGTRHDGKTLCRTCQHGMAIRGAAESNEIIYCAVLGRQVRITVVECNRFLDSTTPSLNDMYQVAWILETSKNSRLIGFTPWREWSEKHGNMPPCPPPMR